MKDQMISLRKTANEMDLLQESLRAAEEYYSKLIRLCGDDAVEFDKPAADELREQLRLLDAQFKSTAGTPGVPRRL